MFNLQGIFSGGQTGVDRAALDFAIENNIEHKAWCPAGRIAEDTYLKFGTGTSQGKSLTISEPSQV